MPPGLGLYISTCIVPHELCVMVVTDRVVTGRTPGTARHRYTQPALTSQGCATE